MNGNFGRNLNVPLFLYLFTHVMNKTALRNVHDCMENFDDMVKYVYCVCHVLAKYDLFNCTKCTRH